MKVEHEVKLDRNETNTNRLGMLISFFFQKSIIDFEKKSIIDFEKIDFFRLSNLGVALSLCRELLCN